MSLQQQQQAQYNRLIEEVRSFETAVDESGNPKAPHFNRVFDRMVGLARGGLVNSIQDAYEMAVSLDKELQAELAEEARKQEALAKESAEAKVEALTVLCYEMSEFCTHSSSASDEQIESWESRLTSITGKE